MTYAGYSAGISSKARNLAIGAVAITAIALLVPAIFGASRRSKAPVRVALQSPHRSDLLATGNVPVRLRSRRGRRVNVAAAIRLRSGRRVRLGGLRKVRLKRGRRRTVRIPISPAGHGALAGCPAGKVIVTVRVGKRRREAGAPLRLDPPDCEPFFSKDSFWNKPLPRDAPLDPDSGAITSTLERQVGAAFASPPPPSINTTHYTPPVYTVGPDQGTVRVQLDRPPGYAPDLQAVFESVPLPEHVAPAEGVDSELVVWQPSTDTLWEFWQLRRREDGWHASWGGRLQHVSTGPGVFTKPPNWGATATSLPLAGGMITPRELREGRIEHALAMAVPRPRAGAFARPAQRTDGYSNCAHSVPEGARFRIDPALDIDALRLPPTVEAMAKAAQRYGMIVRDRSNTVVFYAQNVLSLGSNPYPALFGGKAPWDLLKAFPWSHLQLMRMDLVAAGGDSPVLGDPGELLSGCG